MLGRIDEARALLAETRAELRERGVALGLAATAEAGIEVELLAGDPAAAVAAGEEECALLEELGQLAMLSTVAGRLAQAYYECDRLEEADSWAGRGAELGASDDIVTQMFWRQVRAKVLARRSDHDQAERLAREAVALGDETEMLNFQAGVYADLAEVLSLAGRRREAAEAFEEALERYQRKENLVMAERTLARLTEMREPERRST
jgi:tetratricopeptide (TPR) repeat protein